MRSALAGIAALLAMPGTAFAAADIEGVWSFNGGQVVVRATPDATYTGTIIRPTTLATCQHPVGEVMWVDLRQQLDGQWWGGHQWFQEPACTPIARRGNTAFRVLVRPDGHRFLRACFTRPETPDVQPQIAPDGSSTGVNRSCSDSGAVPPPPAHPTLASVAALPRATKGCRSRRALRIRLEEPPGDALASVSVFVRGRRVALRRGAALSAPIDVRRLPSGRATVRVVARTLLGRTIEGQRRYRTCAPAGGA